MRVTKIKIKMKTDPENEKKNLHSSFYIASLVKRHTLIFLLLRISALYKHFVYFSQLFCINKYFQIIFHLVDSQRNKKKVCVKPHTFYNRKNNSRSNSRMCYINTGSPCNHITTNVYTHSKKLVTSRRERESEQIHEILPCATQQYSKP